MGGGAVLAGAMEVVARCRDLAAVHREPLSPPHSDQSDTDHQEHALHDTNTDTPMDLSSAGAGASTLGLTHFFPILSSADGQPDSMRDSEHPLLNVTRLADLVRLQVNEQRGRETKRKWEEKDDEQERNEDNNQVSDHAPSSVNHPVELIRNSWETRSRETSSPGAGGPGSPAGSSSGSESGQSGSGREEKRRRLDMLLNKKFDKMSSSSLDTCNPILMSTPPPSERETSPASDRRPSTESTGGSGVTAGDRKNRRKQSHPSNPSSPPSISIRPHSDLFPPAATSTPRHKDDRNGCSVPQDYSPARKMSRSQSPHPPQSPKSPVVTKLFGEEKENKDALKAQLLQVLTNSPPFIVSFHIFKNYE